MSEYRFDFSSEEDVAAAMKSLRGRWGSRALDHWVPEFVLILVLLGSGVLAITGVITPRDLIAFVLGYYLFSLLHRRFAQRLAAPFLPDEFRRSRSGSVIVSEEGLSMLSGGSEVRLRWHRIPLPAVCTQGLVFRVAPDLAVPFPTSGAGIAPNELADKVADWKARKPAA